MSQVATPAEPTLGPDLAPLPTPEAPPDGISAGPELPPPGASKFYEVCDQIVVEPPPRGAFETRIASLLLVALGSHVARSALGRVDTEMLYRIDRAANLQRRPDLAFVSYERWPATAPVPRAPAWDVVPDLPVEVISPINLALEVVEKVGDYFRAGVRAVWVVYPTLGLVYVYESFKKVAVLDATDSLEGGPVLPGFRLPLATFFGEGATV